VSNFQFIAHFFPSHQLLGTTYSHADQVVLLVCNGISAKSIQLRNKSVSVVMAELQWKNRRLLVASVHLAPFQSGNYQRKQQMEALLETASSNSLPLIIAGDTNMRTSEDSIMEEDLHLMDVWKLAGSNAETEFTWDTVDHREEYQGGSFNRYYGESARQYRTHYDRIYVKNTTVVDIKEVPSFELIANQPLTSNLHFLSDHFGMKSRLKLNWKKSTNQSSHYDFL